MLQRPRSKLWAIRAATQTVTTTFEGIREKIAKLRAEATQLERWAVPRADVVSRYAEYLASKRSRPSEAVRAFVRRAGSTPLVGSVQGYIRHLLARIEGRPVGEPTPMETERIKLLRVRADLAKIELQREYGGWVPKVSATQALEFLAGSCRERLLELPRKLSVEIDPDRADQIEALLEREVREILEAIVSDDSLPPPEPFCRTSPHAEEL